MLGKHYFPSDSWHTRITCVGRNTDVPREGKTIVMWGFVWLDSTGMIHSLHVRVLFVRENWPPAIRSKRGGANNTQIIINTQKIMNSWRGPVPGGYYSGITTIVDMKDKEKALNMESMCTWSPGAEYIRRKDGSWGDICVDTIYGRIDLNWRRRSCADHFGSKAFTTVCYYACKDISRVGQGEWCELAWAGQGEWWHPLDKCWRAD